MGRCMSRAESEKLTHGRPLGGREFLEEAIEIRDARNRDGLSIGDIETEVERIRNRYRIIRGEIPNPDTTSEAR